ncbi:MAG TPA: ATP-binding protein, partial [Flavisolibacter sp.]|nr:ATP-binding protein [Flavisolibacter sp.]
EENLFINFVYEPLFDESGKAHSVLVIAIDITQQVRSRQAIEDAEERARLAVESAKLGTYDINLKTNEVIPSERFIEIFDVEYTSSHYNYISRVHADDLPKRTVAHEQALQTGKLEYECRLVRRDGTIIWVRIYGQYYFNEQKQPYKIIGIVQDITQQKAGEEELEQRVKERTAELQKLNEELQQFTYVSSHDLKEPLRKIQVFADAAQHEIAQTNDKLVQYLHKVKQSANRMSTLLNDLLNYSLLSNTKHLFAAIDLNSIATHIEDDLELMIREKGATIEKSQLPIVEGIPFQIKQLLYNILINALKFSKADTAPHITIKASELTNEEKQHFKLSIAENYYSLNIIDNGIGFDQESAEKIFVVFQRLHDRRLYTGNGIGLSICKKIAENHNGKIVATSKPGQGSTFTVILPERQHR